MQKNRSFPLRISSVNVTADLDTFSEEILNGKPHFLGSEFFGKSPQKFQKNVFGGVFVEVILQSQKQWTQPLLNPGNFLSISQYLLAPNKHLLVQSQQ